MRSECELTPRELEVLNSTVEAYIKTGEPVASRTISRGRRDKLSPASIRNVMSDLAEQGYLEQPHTSAGRVPTQRAFRVYVQSLVARRLPAAQIERFRAELDRGQSLAERIECSSHFLTQVTRNVGLAAAIAGEGQRLDQIELVKLADRRILMIVITSDRTVRNRVVALNQEVSADELESIRNYVNRNFSGWTLADARQAIEERLRQESAAFDAILARLNLLYSEGLLEIGSTPEIYLEGASNLVGLDLHLTREKMRELFRALEEKKHLLQLLDRFLERPAGDLGVQVGLGEIHPSLASLSLIGIHVTLPSGVFAKIAVLGPLRMDYGMVMSAVQDVGQIFCTLP